MVDELGNAELDVRQRKVNTAINRQVALPRDTMSVHTTEVECAATKNALTSVLNAESRAFTLVLPVVATSRMFPELTTVFEVKTRLKT